MVIKMKKIEVDELREIQIRVLDEVADFCDEHGIQYWLDCGTLLGAVRHKGYIPWDDDIDIGMLREDYNRFITEFNVSHKGSNFEFRSIETHLDWHLPFGKVMDTTTLFIQDGFEFGINIDVFPFDDVPNDRKLLNKIYKKRDKLKTLDVARRNRKKPSGGFIRRTIVHCIRFVLHRFPEFYFVHKLSQEAQKNNNKGLKNIGIIVGDSTRCSSKLWISAVTEATFEGKKYKIPKDYDLWLKDIFGPQYMQLPPENKRKRHSFEAYVVKE